MSSKASVWSRMIHCDTLLGYSLKLCCTLAIPLLALLSSQNWLTLRDGVQVPSDLASPTIWTIIAVCYSGCSIAAVAQSSNRNANGLRFAHVPLLVGLLLVPIFSAFLWLMKVDMKYYALDIVGIILFVVLYIVADKTVREKMAGEKHQAEQKPHSKGGFCGTLLTSFPILLTVFMTLIYPSVILPSFFARGVSTKLLIVLVLHPIAVESLEAFTRSKFTALEKGVSSSDARFAVVQRCLKQISLKQIMACYRRFMLLNIGSSSATIAAVTVTAVS